MIFNMHKYFKPLLLNFKAQTTSDQRTIKYKLRVERVEVDIRSPTLLYKRPADDSFLVALSSNELYEMYV